MKEITDLGSGSLSANSHPPAIGNISYDACSVITVGRSRGRIDVGDDATPLLLLLPRVGEDACNDGGFHMTYRMTKTTTNKIPVIRRSANTFAALLELV
jgi:hypothetical protein